MVGSFSFRSLSGFQFSKEIMKTYAYVIRWKTFGIFKKSEKQTFLCLFKIAIANGFGINVPVFLYP